MKNLTKSIFTLIEQFEYFVPFFIIVLIYGLQIANYAHFSITQIYLSSCAQTNTPTHFPRNKFE